jgi:hypothetical protein
MAKGKEFKRPHNKKTNLFKIKDKEPSPNYDLHKPIFSFKHMKYQGASCISKCEGNEKSSIIDTLLRFSQLTWIEIRRLPRESGFEILPQYRFNNLPKDIITPEVPVLVARYDEGGRLAGFRIDDIYHVVLAGKNLYPH